MKKRIGVVLAAAGLLGGMAAVAALGEEGQGPRDERVGERRGDRGELRRGPGVMAMRGAFNEWVIRRLVTDSKAATDLGLSDEQVKTLKEALEQQQKTREDLQKQLAELEEQQRKLMDEATVDEAALMTLLEKMSKFRLDLDKATLKFTLLAKKTLTPDQVAKLKEQVQQRFGNRGDGDRPRGEGERRRGEGDRPRGEGHRGEAPRAPADPLAGGAPPAVW